MKDPIALPVAEVVARLQEFNAVVDARSPAEFADDHLPGALSAPVLDDEERARVGTVHARIGGFEAKRLGAALVSRNIAAHLERLFAERDRNWRPLVYCWRGGNRSGALGTVMARIGWRTAVLEGGYKAFRRHVIEALATRPAQFGFLVVGGRTGTAKSRLLAQLADRGEQVLDLEALACHRGSVLGAWPDRPQPSQRRFETRLWQQLQAFDPRRPVFVESESRKVGALEVPETLIRTMRASPVARVEADLAVRSGFLLTEYAHLREDTARLLGLLDKLTALHGASRVEQWKRLLQADRWPEFVECLLKDHYDPSYDRSMRRNFERLDASVAVALDDTDAVGLARAADSLQTLARTVRLPAVC
jgi:tRNA 2-selenouridine synthase